jgi:hypothetical protein
MPIQQAHEFLLLNTLSANAPKNSARLGRLCDGLAAVRLGVAESMRAVERANWFLHPGKKLPIKSRQDEKVSFHECRIWLGSPAIFAQSDEFP